MSYMPNLMKNSLFSRIITNPVFFAVLLLTPIRVYAATTFIDFSSEKNAAYNDSKASITLTGNLGSPSALTDYQDNSAMLQLDSATFNGIGWTGKELTQTMFEATDSIYQAFAPAGKAVWSDGGGRNLPNGTNSMALTFSHLKANTSYTFYFMGGRTAASANYNPAMTQLSLTVDGTLAGNPEIHGSTGSLENNVCMYVWTFTTPDDWTDSKTVTLSAENGVYSALRIDATSIPEPSAASLSLLGIASLLLRRRNRSNASL